MLKANSAGEGTPLLEIPTASQRVKQNRGNTGGGFHSSKLNAGGSSLSGSRVSISSLGGGGGVVDPEEKYKFGVQEIIILCVNTMNGPGLLALPKTLAECGLVPGIMALAVMAWVTTRTCYILAESIHATKIATFDFEERRSDGKHNIHLTCICSILFKVALIMLTLTLGSLAIAQITVSAQALDAMAIALTGRSFAVRYYPAFEVISSSSASLQPFGVNQSLVSVGFVVAMIICVGLGYISFSLLACFVLSGVLHILPITMDVIAASDGDITGNASYFGSDPSSIIGVAVFNFSIVIAVPSLFADCKEGARFASATTVAIWAICLMYILIGGLGAVSFGSESDNIMDPMLRSKSLLGMMSSFAFVWAIIPPLPIYTILISRNLEQGVFVPWSLALFLYMSEAFGEFLVWTSILVLGFTNYTMPLMIATKSFSGPPSKSGVGSFGRFVEIIKAAWADDAGRESLVLNLAVTLVLFFVIYLNVCKL